MNNLWERERVKLETLELVGSKLISLTREGLVLPDELVDWLQGRIEAQGKIEEALRPKK